MNFPFEKQAVLETMTDRPLIVSSNYLGAKEFFFTKEISLLPNGNISDGNRWEVINGVLRFLNHSGQLIVEFRMMETRNGCVYAVGKDVVASSARTILHIKKPIMDSFGICISSSFHYEKIAIPRILKSLEGDGFDMNNVAIVIGNDAKNDRKIGVNSETGVLEIRRKNDVFGMTALGNVPDISARPYWLLLHDTCEVTNGFTKSVSGLDIGLNPDMVVLRPLNEKVEFGLYKADFAAKMGDMPLDVKPFDYFGIVVQKAEIITILNASLKKEPEKDVYGKGIRRETLHFPSVGIKKYQAKEADVKRP